MSFKKKDNKTISIYEYCLNKIGNEKNEDIHWYLKKRPKKVNRQAYFNASVEAIYKSGMKRTIADSLYKEVQEFVDIEDYVLLGAANGDSFNQFSPLLKVSQAKKKAIRHLALFVSSFPDDKSFVNEVFDGKTISSELGSESIAKLVDLNQPGIRKINASFIIRNMGGEAIKCDRWIEEFLTWNKMSLVQLEEILDDAKVKKGMFDMAMWAYCEKFVKETSRFESHFNELDRAGHFTRT